MEGAMKQREEVETEVPQQGLRQRPARLQTSTSIAKEGFTALEDGGLDLSPPKMNSGEVELDAPEENSGTQIYGEINIQQEDIVKKIFLTDVNPISEGSNSSKNVISEGEKIRLVKEIEQEVRELILERVYQKPETHAFYCPKCRACIQKVLIQNQEPVITSAPGSFICSSCFSFLIPLGRLLFPGLVPKYDPAPIVAVPASSNVPAISGAFLKPIKTGEDASSEQDSEADSAAIPGASVIPEPNGTEIDSSENVEPPLKGVIVDGLYRVPEVIPEPESSKSWEILKSIVYGGLAESIASLSVVTSAASADATTLNIVALALANLVGGLFILFHNLWELKSEQPRIANYSETNAAKDRYHELLGKKEHFFLHATFAVLSFILFGLVPPLVYGFSFYESGEKDFKLVAVAGASLLCIILLAIAKAYIQRSTGYLTYLKTVLFYVGTGALASIVSYLAGDLIKKLIEKLGWFESSSDFKLILPEMSIEKHTWGSY